MVIVIFGLGFWWPVLPIAVSVVIVARLRNATRKIDTIFADELPRETVPEIGSPAEIS